MNKLFKNVMGWVDARFPATETYEYHMSKYYAPKNFNFWYFFGVLSMVVLVNQLATGIWLTMFYTPDSNTAYDAVAGYIMYDVEYGWLLRYMHSTGASAFFRGGVSAYVPGIVVRLVPQAP
jgi:ubiquinol-cytochrome c reductase cytochrome b subunit